MLETIIKILSGAGIILSTVTFCYYFVLSTAKIDSVLLHFSWKCMFAIPFFVLAYEVILFKMTIPGILLTLLSYFYFLYVYVFGEEIAEKEFEKALSISMIEDCDINYQQFRKLNRTEQIEMLDKAIIRWADGSSDKLIEEEEEWNDYECILNKK